MLRNNSIFKERNYRIQYSWTCERFGMEESTFSYALRDFINILITKFLAEKITFPNTELQINEISSGFIRIKRIPNVISAIDGSHIPIKASHHQEIL
ncbi:putative nuclease HARBI1 [Rhizophagus clarus]|uniref:Putative nuclease HARBI1 n=1 Tax=Rhizophagus clarus TaxID=94130 RepID=A0A8H3LHX5_9GLOM|nr:putative nuclease HARBI1 [Rhizophagus clarus]